MFRLFRIHAFLIAAGLACATAQLPSPPPVLSLPPSLSAAGTGVVVNGTAWGYVVWQATSPEWYAKNDVAVYLKPGNADSALPFVLQGTMAPMTDPTAIQAWVNRSQRLADATGGLAQNLTIAHNDAGRLIKQWTADPNQIVPNDFAARLAMLGNRGKQEPGAASALRALGLNHPVFRFLSGTGWAGPLNVSVGQDATIELREVLRATGAEGPVVARVTLRAVNMEARTSPDLLIAPGPAVQVTPDWASLTLPALETPMSIAPRTPLPDLAPALRWSIPDELRRQILLTRGFMVWRGNSNTSYATPVQLLQAVPALKKTLRDAAPASKIFSSIEGIGTGPQVTDFALDRTTWFVADDNGRFDFTTPAEEPHNTVFTGTPLAWNASYYYHVAAVDLLGRYGPPAPVRQATAVHTLPPGVPRITRIENVVSGGEERLRLSIVPNENQTGQPQTTRYLIFRDRVKNTAAPANSLNKSIDPTRQNEMIYVGTVGQPANTDQEITFTDDSLVPTAPEHYGQTYFYCVRAAHQTIFGYNCSPPSPAVFGTLRDRTGPPAPTGILYTEAPRAGMYFVANNPAPVVNPGLPDDVIRLRFSLRRLDPGISHVEVRVNSNLPTDPPNTLSQQRSLPTAYFGKGDNISFDYPILRPRLSAVSVELRPVTSAGRKGKNFSFSFEAGAIGGQTDLPLNLEVKSGMLMNMNPETDSWFLNFFRRANNSASFFSISPSYDSQGTWTSIFPGGVDSTKSRSLLIQYRSTSGGSWMNLATARLAQNTNTFRYFTPTNLFGYEYRVWEVLDPSDEVVPPFAVHAPLAGNPRGINPINVTLFVPVGASEYRLYRRIDDGPLFLLKQDTGTWDPSVLKTTVFNDGMIPPAGTTISYFGQCFDNNGNPGPLALLDQKVGIIPDLPIPVVDSLDSGGTLADPTMLVKASCPSPGVQQMEIRVTPDPEPSANLVSTPTTGGLLYNFTPGAELTAPQNYNKTLLSLGSFKLDPSQPLIYSSAVRIKQNVEYTFQIRAIGPNGATGVWSAEQKFTWTPPVTGSTVPWPAHPLPKVESWNSAISAFLPSPINYHVSATPSLATRPLRMLSPYGGINNNFPSVGENGFPDHRPSQLGVAVEIGSVRLTDPDADSSNSNWDVYGVSQGVNGTIYKYGSLGVSDLPNAANAPDDLWESQLHRKELMQGDIATYDYSRRMLPVVLYRQQLYRMAQGVNTAVPNADLVQVSPMINSIAWRTINGRAVMVDPYVRAVRRYPINGAYPALSIVIYDTAPVTTGATYAYYLVHFSQDGEPDLIHPCGNVFIPINP
ncbi:hypothetical protein [Luteolibacter luteus]|uniref:Fibronectin type-III domain-containing protein n=1 Tax=Luteolibacter luteus TaxID=2728835 RepID=A0A858RD91_9BACT|nr:hypothetical protein [Luteolibacter luteus]QJE94359.1 hypothetical protein HHL09_00680 [Luteolibacter luteus]